MSDPQAIAYARAELVRRLRAARHAAGLTQNELAAAVYSSRSTIACIETGRQNADRDFWTRADQATGANGRLLAAYDLLRDVDRAAGRALVGPYQGTADALAPSVQRHGADPTNAVGSDGRNSRNEEPPELETLRQRIEEVFSASISESILDDWERLVHSHAAATRHRSPRGLLDDLSMDAADLERLLRRPQPAACLRRLARLTAQMAGLLSLTLLKVNDRAGSRRWARTARRAGAESGDRSVTSWVRAQEAHTHFYAGDLVAAVDTAHEARAIAGHGPSVGATLGAALEARALSLLGRRTEAEAAIAAAEKSLDRLPPDQAVWSAIGYNEAQLRFHQGNALTHLRQPGPAWEAQQRALELYPEGDYLDRTLVLVDRAACLVQRGEIDGGMDVALTCITALNIDQRRGIVETRVREVLSMLPGAHGQQSTPTVVRSLYEVLREDHGSPQGV